MTCYAMDSIDYCLSMLILLSDKTHNQPLHPITSCLKLETPFSSIKAEALLQWYALVEPTHRIVLVLQRSESANILAKDSVKVIPLV